MKSGCLFHPSPTSFRSRDTRYNYYHARKEVSIIYNGIVPACERAVNICELGGTNLITCLTSLCTYWCLFARILKTKKDCSPIF